MFTRNEQEAIRQTVVKTEMMGHDVARLLAEVAALKARLDAVEAKAATKAKRNGK